jgi:DNA-binding winged helix-turn-helix (wHTH) protein/TolB-like protein
MSGDAAPIARSGETPFGLGPWTVEPTLNQLRRGDECLRLEPKVMELLVHLAGRAGQVVHRDALLAAVWPGVVVGDDALTQAVIKLRRALGDTADRPVFIETISKRGYRLIAPVTRVPPMPAPLATAAPPAATPPPSTTPPADRRDGVRAWPARRRVTLAAVALLALAAAAAAVLGLRRGENLPEVIANLPASRAMLERQPSLRVQPLEALGPDPRVAVLARGLSADLATDLSTVPGLTVVTVAGPLASEEAGAPPMPVRYVVSGTVQGDAERLRVNVRLVEEPSGTQLWSQRFERPAHDVFKVQDELAAQLFEVLPVRVAEANRVRVARRYTRHLEAWGLFHQAQLAISARTREQNAAARELYRRAIALDPGFARAYAGVAFTHALDFRHRWTANRQQAIATAKQLAQTARRMAPDSPETLWVLAYVQWHLRQHHDALRVLEHALRLNPAYGDAYGLMGDIATDLGHPVQGIELLRAGARLAPNPGSVYHLLLGRAHYFVGDLQQSRHHLHEALMRNPGNVEAHVYLAAVAARSGDQATALWQVEEIRAAWPGFTARDWLDGYPLVASAQRQELQRRLEALGF